MMLSKKLDSLVMLCRAYQASDEPLPVGMLNVAVAALEAHADEARHLEATAIAPLARDPATVIDVVVVPFPQRRVPVVIRHGDGAA